MLAFFGLTPNIRLQIFREIHEIVFHGNGGFDWHTVYNMPIWLRKYTFNEIRNYYEEEKEAAEGKSKTSGGKQTVIGTDGKVKLPEMLQKAANAKKPIKYS